MLRAIVLMLALLLPAAPRAQSVEEIDVGGATLRIEMPEGYVRLGKRSPEMLEAFGRMIPPNNVLVEALLAEPDYTRTVIGLPPNEVYYQVQMLRELREAPVSAADWTQIRPTLLRELGGLQTERLMEEASAHIRGELETNSGQGARVRMGDAQTKPVVYGDDPRSVRFWMVLPVELQVGDEIRKRRIVTAAATTVLSQRLVFLYAFRSLPENEAADTGAIRASLDAFVERAYRLDAPAK
jgi:hypothetical protein